MFDLGWTELLIIGVVALIVVGPKDLPKMFRTLGQFTAKARNMAREFQRAMDAAADESGVKDIARELRDTASGKDVKDAMGLDELDRDMRKMGRPDQWGKSPSPKPGKSASTKAKPDPAAAPPVDEDEAAVQADDRSQAARAAHEAAMDEERRKRAERAAEARARAAEIRARREAEKAAASGTPPAAAPDAER